MGSALSIVFSQAVNFSSCLIIFLILDHTIRGISRYTVKRICQSVDSVTNYFWKKCSAAPSSRERFRKDAEREGHAAEVGEREEKGEKDASMGLGSSSLFTFSKVILLKLNVCQSPDEVTA